eukprot:6192604-Pleurochrysis_carterae.AAC.3
MLERTEKGRNLTHAQVLADGGSPIHSPLGKEGDLAQMFHTEHRFARDCGGRLGRQGDTCRPRALRAYTHFLHVCSLHACTTCMHFTHDSARLHACARTHARTRATPHAH